MIFSGSFYFLFWCLSYCVTLGYCQKTFTNIAREKKFCSSNVTDFMFIYCHYRHLEAGMTSV